MEETNSDSSWRKQTLIFISDFVKRFPSKKSDKIFNPDTSAVISSKDNNKQTSSSRFRYQDIIKQPMSIEILRKRVESGHIVNNLEFKRNFILMLVNASMFDINPESEVRNRS